MKPMQDLLSSAVGFSSVIKLRIIILKGKEVGNKTLLENFDVLLTVHLSIFISVFNQIGAQNFCFTIGLFHASTCFEHHVLIIRRSKLHYTASGIITLKQGIGLKLLKYNSINMSK